MINCRFQSWRAFEAVSGRFNCVRSSKGCLSSLFELVVESTFGFIFVLHFTLYYLMRRCGNCYDDECWHSLLLKSFERWFYHLIDFKFCWLSFVAAFDASNNLFSFSTKKFMKKLSHLKVNKKLPTQNTQMFETLQCRLKGCVFM